MPLASGLRRDLAETGMHPLSQKCSFLARRFDALALESAAVPVQVLEKLRSLHAGTG